MPQVILNLYEFICSAEHKGRYSEESFLTRLVWGTIDFHNRKENAPELLCFLHSSEYLPLCSAEQTHSYRFGTTWGWVNDDRINFGWTNFICYSFSHSFCNAKCNHFFFLLNQHYKMSQERVEFCEGIGISVATCQIIFRWALKT